MIERWTAVVSAHDHPSTQPSAKRATATYLSRRVRFGCCATQKGAELWEECNAVNLRHRISDGFLCLCKRSRKRA